MWQDGEDSIALPSQAVLRTPFREHVDPDTMGDDAYLHPTTSNGSHDSHDEAHSTGEHSQRTTTSKTRLRGAGMGNTDDGGTKEGGASTARATGIGNDIGETDVMGNPGMPIGLLAARGTRFAKKPLWETRKFKILCPTLGLIVLVLNVVILIFPVLRAIANHTLNVSVLSIVGSNITEATNTTFALTLEGQVRKVGVFPATIYFRNPVDVYWISPENLSQELHLGRFALAPIGVAAGHGRVKQETHFNITDTAGFATFAKYLITQEVFTWRLKSEDVQARAFSFISVKGLNFVKDLTLPGMANMTNVAIKDFQLPGDDPEGGISLAVKTSFVNPSAFGVELGVLTVSLYYEDLYLGPASTTQPFNLTAGLNEVQLVGRMVPYPNDPVALAQLSTVFSNYLAGVVTPVQARGFKAELPGGEIPAWLQAGIQALTLSVPLVAPSGPIRPITGIAIEALSLAFTPETSWSPTANSSFTSATFALPFGFSLDIVKLSNSFSIVNNRNIVASLSAPLGDSETTITTRNSAFTIGSIKLDLPLSPLSIGPAYDDKLAFSQFNYDLTTTNGSKFILIGSSDAVTNTAIGQVKLTGIEFTVPAGLIGLEGLATAPTEIVSVDVMGGTKDAVVLSILFGLINPSNLDLEVSNVTFQLFHGSSFLGTTIIPDLHLATGYQQHSALGYFQANDNADALSVLTDYAQGTSNDLSIIGFNGSTEVESLAQAFMGISLKTTLAGLGTKLLNYANLTVLSSTGVANDGANSVVALNNPFTADLLISNIQSNVTAHGLFVGSIVQDVNFPAAGKGVSISPTLTLNLNLFPPDIFSLVRALVVEAGLDPAALDGVVSLGGITYSPSTPNAARRVRRSQETTDEQQEFADSLVSPSKSGQNAGQDFSEHMFSPDRTEAIYNEEHIQDLFESFESDNANSTDLAMVKRSLMKRAYDYTNFDLPTYVLTAFKSLTVTVDLVSVLHIQDFTTNLAYSQTGVPAYTDSSLTLLLPILARPIVQRIVDASLLNIDTVMITNPSDASFTAGLVGSITNSGPFNAVIVFPLGLTVSWNGAPIGQIAMPNTSLIANEGAQLNLSAVTTVASVSHLTEFTSYLLTEPSFTWQIYGESLEVVALGITVDLITISKEVVLAGMNGFKGDVTINSFDLPSNDPAGGVTLNLQTTLRNPSSVGVQLSTIGFVNFFGATEIGPAASTAPFALTPKSTIQLPLSGRLIPQTTPAGLADVSTIFNGYIHGVPSALIVQGNSAGPSDCTWLNEGIKVLKIPVILPAAVNLQVINSITINQLTLMFTEATAYDPAFSTSNTVAAFQLPFAFPVDITAIQTTLTAQDGSTSQRMVKRDTGDFASLVVPQLPGKTDVVARTLLLTFANIPFTSLDNSIFSSFLVSTTDGNSQTFGLHGMANTVTSTAIGELYLQDITFSVQTSILGLQGLNARPAVVSNLDVFHGYPTYLQINADASLYNPSNITIGTGDVTFGLQFESQIIGSADITNLVLVPGVNIVPTAVHYQPTGGASTAAGLMLLENYVQGIASDTVILGNTGSGTTPIKSLQAALATIRLNTEIPPLTTKLITQASLTFPLDIATTETATAHFMLANPFTAQINLLSVLANATYNGLYLGQIRVDSLNPVINAPGHSTINSPALPFALNADPKALARFLEAAAANNGVNLGILLPQFDFLFSETSTMSTVVSSVNLNPETCTPSGTTALVNGLILASVKGLVSNLSILSNTKLDDFATPLAFVQNNVPTVLDDSVLYLTGILGKTLVSRIVDLSTLSFSQGLVTNVTDNGFAVQLTGALLNAGPFDALISFPKGVSVEWQGKHIADIALPPICSTGSVGVPKLESASLLTIANLADFTEFATYILLNPDFTWIISTPSLRVEALGTIFDNVLLTKTISFKAFNGLPGVTIVNPDFPGDSGSSILLSTSSTIPSQSNLGIELGHVSFVASFMGQEVGPIDGFGLTLLPLAPVTTTLKGTIIKRSGAASTDSLGILFSGFLAGENQTLSVTGNEVITPAQPNSPVNWLTAAFKKLTIQVVLPGKKYTIISSIALEDLAITIEEPSQAYTIPASNNITNVVYQNPFKFSLTALDAGGEFIINYNNADAAVLNLPVAPVISAGTSRGDPQPLVLNFKNQVLQSLNNDAFNSFFAAVTITPSAAFTLHGTSNVTARTVVGDLLITGIPFSVPTSFKGINQFGGTAIIPATPLVIGSGSGNPFAPTVGGSTFMRITLNVILANPAPLILHTNMISFEVLYKGTMAGRAFINPLDLYPGQLTVPSEFQYGPADPNNVQAQALLTQYLSTTGAIDLTIQGDTSSSPYGSLQKGLAGTKLETSFKGLGGPLIHDIVIDFDPVVAICQNAFTFTTRITNALKTDITLLELSGTAYQSGTEYSTYGPYTLKKPLNVAPGGTLSAYSEPIPAVLTQKAQGSLGLLFTTNKGLDITITTRTAVSGYVIPSLQYFQAAVPYVINPSFAGQTLSLQSVGGILSDPGAALGNLLGELASATQCVGGVLSLLPGQNPLTNLPGVLSGVIAGLNPILSPVRGVASSVVGEVTSIVGGANSVVGSVLNPLVGSKGVVPIPAVTSIVPAVVSAVLPSAGITVVPGVVVPLRKRDGEAEAPAPTPMPQTTAPAHENQVPRDVIQRLFRKHGFVGLVD